MKGTKLFTFAHYNEAFCVVDYFSFKRVPLNQDKATIDLFYSEEINSFLLITGEGSLTSLCTLAKFFSLDLSRSIKNLINMGVAGSLKDTIKLDSLYKIRTSYRAIGEKFDFHSFTTLNSSENKKIDLPEADLISNEGRVHEERLKNHLSVCADLVDCEFFAQAQLMKSMGINFSSYKIVSDLANSKEFCQLNKDNSLDFSRRLADFLRENLAFVLEEESSSIDEEDNVLNSYFKNKKCYFTITQRRNFKKLYSLFMREYEGKWSHEDIKNKINRDVIDEKDLPKNNGKKIIYFLEQSLNPYENYFEKIHKSTIDKIKKNGFDIQIRHLEKELEVDVRFSAKNSMEWQQKIKDLKEVDVGPLLDFYEALDFHQLNNFLEDKKLRRPKDIH